MNLTDGKIGSLYTVESINLGQSITRRLQMLGMTNGTAVEILNKKKSGSVIFKLRGTRFAVGKKFAQGIKITGENNG